MYGALLTSSLLRVWRQWQGRVGAIKDPDPPVFSYSCRPAAPNPGASFSRLEVCGRRSRFARGHSFSSIRDYDGGAGRQSVAR